MVLPVVMWELDHKEGWMLKNWCFWTVVLEKTLDNSLASKEIKPGSRKGNQPWIFISRTDAEAEAPIPWPHVANSQLTGREHGCRSLLRFLPMESVMLSKAHLTSHSRTSGSRWAITPSWLSGSWRSFLYSSSVYSCHLLLISSASVRSLSFLSDPYRFRPLLSPSLHEMFPVSLIFLKKSLDFPVLLSSSFSLHWSPRKASYLS